MVKRRTSDSNRTSGSYGQLTALFAHQVGCKALHAIAPVAAISYVSLDPITSAATTDMPSQWQKGSCYEMSEHIIGPAIPRPETKYEV